MPVPSTGGGENPPASDPCVEAPSLVRWSLAAFLPASCGDEKNKAGRVGRGLVQFEFAMEPA